ncbi:MAG TPA: fumarylacetoacetate hydrolase family protein [Stellaceae bacterium]|nr:fumarylacetoacetate hydrolase family protein [Stellaceae bacterium]
MNAEGAARLLVAARQSGRTIADLDGEFRPATEADAYAVQEATLRLLGAREAGWKVGAANAAAPPVAAPLVSTLVQKSPAHFAAREDAFRAVEAELCLVLGRDLPQRASPYGEDEAWAAVASVHAAIELLDTRFADRTAMAPPVLLADMQNNGGFCYGPPNPVAGVDFLAARASLLIDGKEVKSAVGGNPAGHPKRLLAWLADHAASRGRPLRAGMVVTTGSHTGITVAPLGSRVTARFAGLGESVLDLAPA